MANVNNPSGFLPYMNPNSACGGQAKKTYLNLSATNSVIYKGSPVKISSGDVNIAAAGDAICGIAAEYKAANTGGLIAVFADPDQLFVAQTDDGTGTLTAATDCMKNVNHIGTSGSNFRSTAEIDESTADTTATKTFKAFRLSDDANNAYGEFNRWVVKINNHQLGASTGTSTG